MMTPPRSIAARWVIGKDYDGDGAGPGVKPMLRTRIAPNRTQQ